MGPVTADTHAAIWYLLDSHRLSPAAAIAIEEAVQGGHNVYVATISLVELVYLVERGRLPAFALTSLALALAEPVSPLVPVALDLAVAETIEQIPRDEVPDMPDRIIAATALHLGVPLVTRDQKSRASAAIQTIW